MSKAFRFFFLSCNNKKYEKNCGAATQQTHNENNGKINIAKKNTHTQIRREMCVRFWFEESKKNNTQTKKTEAHLTLK